MAKAQRQTPPPPDAEQFDETVQDTYGQKKPYQEWEVKIVNQQVEKLKVKRARVMITDEVAATLNAGIESGGNTYATMYYLPE